MGQASAHMNYLLAVTSFLIKACPIFYGKSLTGFTNNIFGTVGHFIFWIYLKPWNFSSYEGDSLYTKRARLANKITNKRRLSPSYVDIMRPLATFTVGAC